MTKILVLKNDDGIRPAGKPDACFYCKQKVGTPHCDDCITLLRKARIKITFELDAFVFHHDKENIKHALTYKPSAVELLLKQIIDQMENDILEPEVQVKKIYKKTKRHEPEK